MNENPDCCPHCGSPIDRDAVFCRHCGSSDSDGWSDEGDAVTDDEFDYDQFVEDNFSPRLTNTQTRPIFRIVAILLLALFALSYLCM